jgi:TolA-binding protein
MAQQDELDPEMRIDRLENQLRTLTGQNEELQYRNRQLEEQLRVLQGQQGSQPQPNNQAMAPSRPGAPNVVAAPPAQQNQGYYPPPAQQPAYGQQPYGQQPVDSPAVITAAPPPQGGRGRRNDAFDPNQNPNAPGAPTGAPSVTGI